MRGQAEATRWSPCLKYLYSQQGPCGGVASHDPTGCERPGENAHFRAGSAVQAAAVGECIHPRRARPFAHSLGSIRRGIFAGYSAFESRFSEPIASGLVP
jgi:hypothetical protein